MNEKQNQLILELSEDEFVDQVNLARAQLDQVYSTSRPLLGLGYNGAQIRILDLIYDAVRKGVAVRAERNLNYPFYQHHARFENQYGYFAIELSGNKDFRILGGANEALRQREKYPIGNHPHLFLLQKALGQEIELRSIAERVFRGKYSGHSGTLKMALARLLLTRELAQVRYSYKCEWLNDETKQEIVFYFPARDEYIVFRKVHQNGSYEIWGEEINVGKDRIQEALTQKRNKQNWVFQLSPAPVTVKI